MDASSSRTDPSPFAEIYLLPDESPPTPKRGRVLRVISWALLLSGVAIGASLAAFVITGGVEEWHRKACHAHLGRLGLAFHNYHERHGHFPAPAIVDRAGKPLLSWRVALLPQLGHQSLYARFHLDEPWDSPHNRSLLAEMPPELACPSGARGQNGLTSYRVIVGPTFDQYSVNTAFTPDRGVEIREITDGTSSAILALETETPIPWTRPDELLWAPNEPLPALKSRHGDGTHILLADGSARYVKRTISFQILLGLFTINGGEVLASG
jgi:prepilin-type processing-associated H-X9-DG protein